MSRSKMIAINKIVLDIEEMRAVAQVLRSGNLTSKSGSGPNVMKFENQFSNYIGTKYAVAMNSGTAALHAALLAADVGRGDEVIVPSFTFVATAEVVALTGAKPVFADINPETYCLDPAEIELAITTRTKAIIPVHLYGFPAEMDEIMKIARKNNLIVIEDGAQAHGAKKGEKFTGNLGDMGCFSFYGGKNMTTGEGGMVTTNSRRFSDLLRTIRNHGEAKAYQSVMIGHNYRMGEIQAAIGLIQLAKLPKFLEERRKNAKTLLAMLEEIEELKMPVDLPDYQHAWYVFTVRLLKSNASKRNKTIEKIRRRRVDARVYYPKPIHRFPYYQKRYGSFRLKITETTARQVFSLPVHPGLNDHDLKKIGNSVKAAMGQE